MLCLSYTLVYKINVYGGLVICRGQDEDAKEKKGSNNDAQEGWGCANAGALAQGICSVNPLWRTSWSSDASLARTLSATQRRNKGTEKQRTYT